MAISYPNPYNSEEATGASVLSLDDGHVIASVTSAELGSKTVTSVEWTATSARLSLDGAGGKSVLLLGA